MRLIILVAMLFIPWPAVATTPIPLTVGTAAISGGGGTTSGSLPLTTPFTGGACTGPGTATVSTVGGAIQIQIDGSFSGSGCILSFSFESNDIGFDYDWVLLAITGLLLLLVYLVVRGATASPWGRVLRAIRENEDTAKSVGKSTSNYRMQSFVLGGALMGLAGALFAHRNGTVAPDAFGPFFTFLVWTMLIVGGSGNNRGAVLGALTVSFVWFGTPLIQEDLPDFLGTRVFQIRQLVIGLLIVVFLLLRPQGLLPEQPIVSRFVRAGEGGSRISRWLGRGPPGAREPPTG